MTGSNEIREGGCACGAVRFTVLGDPLRAGLCHCMTCRKAHASASNPFLVFAEDQVKITGEMTSWFSSPCYSRRFCTKCGSRVTGGYDNEIELSLGSFDEPALFEPQFELWVIRREPWVAPLDVPQFNGNRIPD
jgi:hypothetical protein